MNDELMRKKEIWVGAIFFAVGSYFFISLSVLEYFLTLVAYFIAKLAISLFCKTGWYFKLAGIILNGSLIFMFFLPKEIKNGLAILKSKENQLQNKNQGAGLDDF